MNSVSPHVRENSVSALSLIEHHIQTQPEHVAVLFQDEAVSYGELGSRIEAMALSLKEKGLGIGSRVCIVARNTPDYYAAYFGVLKVGGTLFPINADLGHNEIAYIVKKTDPALVLYGSDCREIVDDAWRRNNIAAPLDAVQALMQHGSSLLSSHACDAANWPQRDPDSAAVVIHTSGTTALPKGVVATDRMEIASARALIQAWGLGPGDISVCALPLSYTFGLFTASFVALCAGATVLLFNRFNPVRVLEGVARHGATYMVGVPAMYAMMLEHVEQTGCAYDLSRVRFMASSGAPIASITKKEFHQRMGVPLLEYYALSECTPIFSFDTSQPLPPISSSGKLVAGAEVKILNDEGQAVALGETGKLFVRSERLMPGYYLDPERNATVFVNGWFNTADLAYCDTEGYYHVVGRERDQVISGGYKISSAEVEDQILLHENVAQAAVVGSPDKILGEVVKAVLVLKDGRHATEAEIISHCEARLAHHKVPRIVEFRHALPTSPAGKVLKRQLV